MLGKLDRMKLEHPLTSYIKINSKCVKHLNIILDSVKLLEENIIRKLFDINHSYIDIFIFLSFVFLGPHPQQMEVPRLGVELEVQPLAYARATAMPDPSSVCDLHHSSQQRRILNPLRKARDQTRILVDPSWVR